MITLRIKSESGTLKCEYSEMEKPKKRFGFLESNEGYLERTVEYENSFTELALSKEAREYLMAIYTSSFGFEAALLPDELSDKSTEIFEVVKVYHLPLWHYELNLKSVPVAENVEQSITPQPMKSAEQIIDTYFKYNAFDKKRVVEAMEEYASQFKNKPTEMKSNIEIAEEIYSALQIIGDSKLFNPVQIIKAGLDKYKHNHSEVENQDELWGDVIAKIKQYGLNRYLLKELKSKFKITRR